MPRERLVVIGGVAAGMSAASRARKINRGLEIIVLEKGAHVSYGICGLPYYVSGEVSDWHELVVHDAEFFRSSRGIDVRLEHEATAIEPGRKVVHVLERGSRPQTLHYDKLVLSTGGEPALRVDGANLPNVFGCNDLNQAIALRKFIEENKPTRAVVVGSGYIGLEMADALVRRGVGVALLERSDVLLDGLDADISTRVESELIRHGVEIVKGAEVTSISPGGDGLAASVLYGEGGSRPADLVILAAGILPRTMLAESAGVQLGSTGAIAVDERMQTSVNAIYAAGDCAEVRQVVSGAAAYIPLGTTANKQGRVAGENAAGGNAAFHGVVGTLVTKAFGLEIARTGLSTAGARQCGFHPDTVSITAPSRAKYLGGKPVHVSLIWDGQSARLLGGQMAGEEGVAKRIDVLAMALHARMRLQDLEYADLSYAPPVAPVWDPLLIAAHEALKKLKS